MKVGGIVSIGLGVIIAILVGVGSVVGTVLVLQLIEMIKNSDMTNKAV
jgi:hypothetical protein